MSAELKLRNYQQESIDAVFNAWSEGLCRPAVVLPTGAGKTVVFAHLVKRWRQGDAYDNYGPRVMVLVHRDELADQAIAKIRSIAPELNVGKVKAQDNDVTADVMVCSVQTLAGTRRLKEINRAEESYGKIGLIITDECHHGAAPTYKKIYGWFPDALNVGFTATLARGDGVGLGGVWDDVVYRKSPLWMMSKGYLTGVRAVTIRADFDLGSVGRSRGDYKAADLGEALMESHFDKAVTQAYVEHAKDRPGVVFTPTVQTAHAVSESLTAAGVVSAVISGETPREERQDIFRRYREGGIQVLSNCMVLTEGFDAPWAEVCVVARPTQSEPLYQQMVGRVLRPWPGKEEALVLHVAGSGGTLRTLVDLDPTARVEMVRDGESLADAVARETEAAGITARPGTVAFELKMREHDLFKGSAYAWSKTKAGVLFIECGERTVFLWPTKDGRYTVCTAPKRGNWKQTRHAGLDLSTAMAWGEAVSEDFAAFGVTRSAAWRRKPASEKQRALIGLEDEVKMTQGEASDLIGSRIASRRFDRYVGKIFL